MLKNHIATVKAVYETPEFTASGSSLVSTADVGPDEIGEAVIVALRGMWADFDDEAPQAARGDMSKVTVTISFEEVK